MGEWYRFADVDADGDLDLLAEQPFSYIKYYRNDGERGAYHFVLGADTLKDADGTPIFSDRQNIPQLGDLDCNGRVRSPDRPGRRHGRPLRGGARPGTARPPSAWWRKEFEGIRIIGQQVGPPMPFTPGPSMHGANTMALADHDGDARSRSLLGRLLRAGACC